MGVTYPERDADIVRRSKTQTNREIGDVHDMTPHAVRAVLAKFGLRAVPAPRSTRREVIAVALALILLNVHLHLRRKSSPGNGVTAETVEKIRRNYPDTKLFASFSAMVAAFPPDKGLEPSPDTDPDFWTVK